MHRTRDGVGNDAGLERKRQLLAQALERRAAPQDPLELLAEFGGYEIAMLTGAVLAGAARRTLILVDGFTVTVAAALAAKFAPACWIIAYSDIVPRNMGTRAARAFTSSAAAQSRHASRRGSGAAVALSVVRAAVALFTQMATFAGAGVSNRE